MGGALLAAGGLVAGSWRARPGRGPARPLRFFSPAEFATMSAVADTFIAAPSDQKDIPSPADVQLVERLDAALAEEDPRETKDLKTLLFLLERGAPILGLRLGFFSAMSDDARAAYLAGWESSLLSFKRSAFAALHYLVFLHYYDDPRTWAGIGYPGPREIVGMKFR